MQMSVFKVKGVQCGGEPRKGKASTEHTDEQVRAVTCHCPVLLDLAGNSTEHASRGPPIPGTRKLGSLCTLRYLWTRIHHGELLPAQPRFQLTPRESFWPSHRRCSRTRSAGAATGRVHSSCNTPGPLRPAWNVEVLSGIPAAILDHEANGNGNHMLKMEEQQRPRNWK